MKRNENAKTAILKALAESEGPLGAFRLVDKLAAMDIALQPRTIRFYLLQLDRDGLTRFVSRRRGRELTARGREELARANVFEKVGFVAARVDTLGYRMTFRAATGLGTVVFNMSLVEEKDLPRAVSLMHPVFTRGLGMGTKLALARGGQAVGALTVPAGMAALVTVCSVSVNGILLHEGVPVTSRFGGLLEMRGGQPVRFVELIEYAGTTLDPLEAFIRAGMTRAGECARTGTGLIGASFREFPSVAADSVRRVCREMAAVRMAGVMALGRPNLPLLGIPVTEGRCGMVVVGGLNPVAAVHEAGVPVRVESLAGLEDFQRFHNIATVRENTPRA